MCDVQQQELQKVYKFMDDKQHTSEFMIINILLNWDKEHTNKESLKVPKTEQK